MKTFEFRSNIVVLTCASVSFGLFLFSMFLFWDFSASGTAVFGVPQGQGWGAPRPPLCSSKTSESMLFMTPARSRRAGVEVLRKDKGKERKMVKCPQSAINA